MNNDLTAAHADKRTQPLTPEVLQRWSERLASERLEVTAVWKSRTAVFHKLSRCEGGPSVVAKTYVKDGYDAQKCGAVARELSGRLQTPRMHAPEIYGHDEITNTLFIEFVEGEPADVPIRRFLRGSDLGSALDTVRQCAVGLADFHESLRASDREVVLFSDCGPHNTFLGSDGRVVFIDLPKKLIHGDANADLSCFVYHLRRVVVKSYGVNSSSFEEAETALVDAFLATYDSNVTVQSSKRRMRFAEARRMAGTARARQKQGRYKSAVHFFAQAARLVFGLRPRLRLALMNE